MVERLRPLIISAQNRSSSRRWGFEASSGHVGHKQVLLAGGQVFFLGDFPFSPHLLIDSAQNE